MRIAIMREYLLSDVIFNETKRSNNNNNNNSIYLYTII